MVALQEIRKFQKPTLFLIRMLPFVRWVMEIAKQIQSNLRFQAMAPLAIQEAAEVMLSIYLMMQICVPSIKNALL